MAVSTGRNFQPAGGAGGRLPLDGSTGTGAVVVVLFEGL